MRLDDPNLPYLRCVAEALGALREQMVFVGGAVAGLLVTDPLADRVRATKDVDAVVQSNRAMFHRIEEEVAKRGFQRDMTSDVICRWIHKESGVLFDLMPVESNVLGFTNRWYPFAVETAVSTDLGNGLRVRLVSAAGFVATKLEAFLDRGKGDYMTSHDLEDILNVVDGREELAVEIAAAPAELRDAVAKTFAQLMTDPDFENVLPGLISQPERAGIVMARLKGLAARDSAR